MRLTKSVLMGAKIENLIRLAHSLGMHKQLDKMSKKQLVSLITWKLRRENNIAKGNY